MITHLVLYQLRPDVTGDDKARFIAALEQVRTAIPSLRGVRVGRRRTIGASYDALAGDGYSHFALFDFDDEAALRAYLAHPAHVELGKLFWTCATRMVALDYEIAGDNLAETLRDW